MKVVQNLAKCDDVAPIKLTFHGVLGDPVTKKLVDCGWNLAKLRVKYLVTEVSHSILTFVCMTNWLCFCFLFVKKRLRSHSSVSDKEESLDECEEPVEEKRQESDYRISTPINESSEDEAEVRITLEKKLLVAVLVGF